MLTKSQNGSNIIVLNPIDEILVVHHGYGEKLWGLPGGSIERGETPRHAAQEETEEETGLQVYEHKMEIIALCTQRLGLMTLYRTRNFDGSLISEPTTEILQARFMSPQEIINRRSEFGVAYLRMIIIHLRCLHRLDTPIVERRLVDKIEYPRDLGLEFEGVLLQI